MLRFIPIIDKTVDLRVSLFLYTGYETAIGADFMRRNKRIG